MQFMAFQSDDPDNKTVSDIILAFGTYNYIKGETNATFEILRSIPSGEEISKKVYLSMHFILSYEF